MLQFAQIICCHFFTLSSQKIKLYYKCRQEGHGIITFHSLLVALLIGIRFWKAVWQYLLRVITYLQPLSQ